MVKQMYIHKVRSPIKEIEMDQLQEKIRDVKMQITSKYNQLRFNHLNTKKHQTDRKLTPIHSPLTELKKGVELLEKETLKYHQ
ncbi:unnamed protein product [Sphagnum balticum]